LGVEVRKVSIDGAYAESVRSDLAGVTEHKCATWLENAQISVAGLIANTEISSHGIRMSYDLANTGGVHGDQASFITYLAHAAGFDQQKAKELVEPTFDKADATLSRARRQWLDLADRLKRRRTMSADDIAKILGPLPRVGSETRAERDDVEAQLIKAQERTQEGEPMNPAPSSRPRQSRTPQTVKGGRNVL